MDDGWMDGWREGGRWGADDLWEGSGDVYGGRDFVEGMICGVAFGRRRSDFALSFQGRFS
jgi:hypothetical protein